MLEPSAERIRLFARRGVVERCHRGRPPNRLVRMMSITWY
ncbi:Uncharacterised protein [Amycolatopsis camponoti]|uniref:Uncharacterized protein n=1 Tax=Amycolatopsis camponoti TaxID=2606593 RepID=A0A6I8LQB1_9PSEU|nr:Uncharacterised protein [Amycolatopsis camponoti]